jgi:polyisoprenoid-binding protein YceI
VPTFGRVTSSAAPAAHDKENLAPMTSSAQPITDAPTGTYAIDVTESTVTFGTTSFFGLLKAPASFTIASGHIVVTDPSNVAIDVTLDAASFDSKNPKRDTHIRSADFLDVAKHPTIAYRSNAVAQHDEHWHVDGTLTVKGVGAPVALHVTSATLEGDTVRVQGTATVDRYAHGVKKMGGMVGRRVPVTLDIVAKRS